MTTETREQVEARLRRNNRLYGSGNDLTTLRLNDAWPGFFEAVWECDAQPEALRSVHFSIGPGAAPALLLDRAGSTRESAIEISHVPASVPAHEVLRVLNGLVMWPWPRRLRWCEIAELRPGAVICRASVYARHGDRLLEAEWAA